MKKFVLLIAIFAPLVSTASAQEPLLNRIISPGMPTNVGSPYVVHECTVFADHFTQLTFNLVNGEHTNVSTPITLDAAETKKLIEAAKTADAQFEIGPTDVPGVEYYAYFGVGERLPLKLTGRHVGENFSPEAQTLIQQMDALCGKY